MRNLPLITSSIFLTSLIAACATVDAPVDDTLGPTGSGASSSGGLGSGGGSGGLGSGGLGSGGGSGGLSTGGSGGLSTGGTGASAGTGGSGGSPVTCEPGETTPCSEAMPSRPVGDATCALSGNGFDTSACAICEEDSTRACQDPNKPDGVETCTGGDWVAACNSCTPGNKTDCADLAIGATHPHGEATCVAGDPDNFYDTAACKVCEGSETIACGDLPSADEYPYGDANCVDGDWDASTCMACEPGTTVACSTAVPERPYGDAACASDGSAFDTSTCKLCEADTTTLNCTSFNDQDYTGGTATCDSTGDAFDKSSCEWCGNGVVDDGEVCDGSVPAGLTCEDLGYTGDSDEVTTCRNDCSYETTQCSICDAGITTCMGENAGTSCNDANCNNAQCGTGETCSFTMGWGNGFTGASCNWGATCDMTCMGGGADCEMDCESGSSCNLNATSHQSAPTGVFNCASGSTCTWDFRNNGGTVGSGVSFNCEDGATCEILIAGWQSQVGGIHCADGSTCNFTFGGVDQKATFTYTCEDGASCSCTPGSTGGNANTCACTGDGC